MNPSFLGYKLPTSVDMPEIVPIFVEHPHPDGPFGAKGMGETTNVAIPPAIANAVYDAVGVRIRDLPLTPNKVLAALRHNEKMEARERARQDKVTA
jgi:CO/xanthine dehydrogenase Mo-binding subunit